jgi:hypothetical protein
MNDPRCSPDLSALQLEEITESDISWSDAQGTPYVVWKRKLPLKASDPYSYEALWYDQGPTGSGNWIECRMPPYIENELIRMAMVLWMAHA